MILKRLKLILKSPLISCTLVLFILLVGGLIALCFSRMRESSNQNTYEEVGISLFRQKQFEDAIKYWQKALVVEPDNIQLINKIGIAYIEAGKIGDALKFYEEKSKLYPKCLNLRYNLALSLFKNGQLDRCKEELDRIFAANPFFPRVHYLRGLIEEKRGNWLQAKREYIKEINLNPGSIEAWARIKGKHKYNVGCKPR